jgi:hypothetical protein
VFASPDCHGAIPERTGENMNAIQGEMIQLADIRRPQSKRPFDILDMRPNYFDGKVELPNAVFGLAFCYFVFVGYQFRNSSNAHPILHHCARSARAFKRFVNLVDEFARNPRILYIRVAIRKTTALLADLLRSHFDLARGGNKLFKIISHAVLLENW